MPTNRGLPYKIVWGNSLEHTLNSGYPLDAALAYSEPREGSEFAQSASGLEDAWVTGHDEILEGIARWIPAAAGTTPEGLSHTGWDDAAGWAAFLRWAAQANAFRFHPDRTSGTYVSCYLVMPIERPESEDDFTRRVRLRLRSVGSVPFTGY